jgi:hypothetical protein
VFLPLRVPHFCLRAQSALFSESTRKEILRDVHEDARDVARRLMQTKAFLKFA